MLRDFLAKKFVHSSARQSATELTINRLDSKRNFLYEQAMLLAGGIICRMPQQSALQKMLE